MCLNNRVKCNNLKINVKVQLNGWQLLQVNKAMSSATIEVACDISQMLRTNCICPKRVGNGSSVHLDETADNRVAVLPPLKK